MMHDIHSNCRKCDKVLTIDEIKVIKEQVDDFHYPSDSLAPGPWHGLCKTCKANDTDPFVVS